MGFTGWLLVLAGATMLVWFVSIYKQKYEQYLFKYVLLLIGVLFLIAIIQIAEFYSLIQIQNHIPLLVFANAYLVPLCLIFSLAYFIQVFYFAVSKKWQFTKKYLFRSTIILAVSVVLWVVMNIHVESLGQPKEVDIPPEFNIPSSP